jgi:hypothetical protein
MDAFAVQGQHELSILIWFLMFGSWQVTTKFHFAITVDEKEQWGAQ